MAEKSERSQPKISVHDTEEVAARDITLTEADFQRRPEQAPPPPEPPVVEAPTTPAPAKPVRHAGLGEVGAKIQRATDRARDVQDHAMHRVQKVREVSSVVIEEAGYDPSLRFVLVAAVLFVLFLLIMLLNKLIG